MKRYPEYKSVDLPWLKEVPNHWELWRNKNIFTEMKTIVGDESSNYTLLSLTTNGIIPRDTSSGKGKFPEKFDNYKIVKPGYMAFCLFDIDETPRTVGLSNIGGMLTGAYTIMDVHNINPRYAYYYYLALDNVKALKPLYTGLRKTININTFQSVRMPVPTREEQNQIVGYLDWQLSKINKLITAKKKEIAFIEELKKTIIDDAVTHGIDKGTPKKYSGYPWIGDIPEHWEMKYSKQFFGLRKDKAYANDKQLTASQKYGIITQEEFMRLENRRVMVVMKGEDILKHVEKGDFVISMRSFQGGIEYSESTGKISSAYVMLIRNHDIVYDEYFKWLFKSPSYIKALQGTSDLVRDGQALRYSNFSKVYLPLIPLDEQKQIAGYLEKVLEKYEEYIDKVTSQIKVLKELKTKIIFDVVTGQIDVRNIVILEYEFTEEQSEEESDDFSVETEEQED